MPDYKVTFFFEGLQPNIGTTASSVVAWTETWYRSGTSVDTVLAQAVSFDLNTFIGKRKAFLHALYAIKWVRVSNDLNPRETKLAAVPGTGRGALGYVEGGGPTPYNAATAAQVNCCVLADLAVLPDGAGTRTHHRRILLRGLPSAMITGNIINETSAGFTGLIRFLDYVGRGRSPNNPQQGVACPYTIRFQDEVQAFQPITALATGGLDSRTLTISAPLPAALYGRRVAVRKVDSIRGVNRIWTVTNTPGAALGGPYILRRSKRPLAGVWAGIGDGEANLITPKYRPADQYTLIGLRNKHTGSGIFGRTRGRRQAR